MAMGMGFGCLGYVRFGVNVREWHDREAKGRDTLLRFDDHGKRVCPRRIRAKLGRVGICGGFDQVTEENISDDSREKVVDEEELDVWLQNSVPEIVKNMGKAPLLVQVYKESGPKSSVSQSTSSISSSSNTNFKLVIQKATPDIWPLLKQRWENSCYTVPNCIIFVEELDIQDNTTTSSQHQDKTRNLERHSSNSRSSSSSNCDSSRPTMQVMDSPSTTRSWGVVVQGIGLNFPSCYLLKTCQVQSCFGFSTHFCLAKVDCFGESVDFHLNKLWLQR